MIVNVRHPAAMTHVPPRSRNARLTYASVETPVELVRATASEFREVCVLPRPTVGRALDLPVHERDGVAWKRLVHPDGSPVTHAEWADFLAGPESEDISQSPLRRAFERTPLLASFRTGKGSRSCGARTKGQPLDVAAQKQVVSDGRAAASAALVRFLQAEVVLVEDGVMARYRPMANRNGNAIVWTFSDQPIWAGRSHPPVRPDRAWEAAGFWPRRPYEIQESLVDGSVAPILAAMGDLARTDDDVAFLANATAGKVAQLVEDQSAARLAFGRTDAMVRASIRIAEMEAVAATGGYGIAEAPDALREMADIARTAMGVYPHYQRDEWDRLEAYVELLRERVAGASRRQDIEELGSLAR